MSNPYESLPASRFWRSGVADVDALSIEGLWRPKRLIKHRTRIVTAGSCFAQHFSRALVGRGYRWLDMEPGPAGLTAEQRRDYSFGTFSFRTGNIYTPRMLRQWLAWALDREPQPDEVWEKDGRFYDPFRPAIEPDGFAGIDELRASRDVTLEAIRSAVSKAQVFVFTMGLTEAWQNRTTGVEYAVCPGTVAGTFDPAEHIFVNHRFASLMADMTSVLRKFTRHNRTLHLILTVSPVPLTATASGEHVLTATSHSKALLRAVASELAVGRPRVDYFPSYEIITHPVFRGRFFAPNLRSVLPEGVDHVMTCFFRDQAALFQTDMPATIEATRAANDDPLPMSDEADDLRCEEEVLAAFGPT